MTTDNEKALEFPCCLQTQALSLPANQQSRPPSCSPQGSSVLTELQAEAQEGQQPSQGQQHQEAITVKHYCLFYLLFMASPPTRNLSCGENKRNNVQGEREVRPLVRRPGSQLENNHLFWKSLSPEKPKRERESASTPLSCLPSMGEENV